MSLLAPLIAGGLGIAGGLLQNSANKDLQQSTNDANARLAAENRQWQEAMANTAHQRQVKDLKAAGLNPILSATGGSGAATPSGGVAQMQAARMENVIGQGISSAKSGYEMDLATKSLMGDLALKDASATAAAAQTAQSISTARRVDAETMGIHYDNVVKQYEAPAKKSGAKLKDMENKFDQKTLYYDKIMDKAEQATGMVGNLVPAIKLRPDADMKKLRKENKTMKDYINSPSRRR